MNDPKRMLDELDDVSEAERRALVAGRDVRPSRDFSGDVWGALALQLPPAGPLDPTGGAPVAPGGSVVDPSAAASTASAAAAKVVAGTGLVSMVKAAVVGAAVGTAVLTGKAIVPSSSPTETVARGRQEIAELAPVGPATSDPAIVPAIPEPERRPMPDIGREVREAPGVGEPSQRGPRAGERERARVEDRAGELPPESPFAAPERAARAPTSAHEWAQDGREESRVVAQARDALRSGDATSSLAWLEQARQKYPNGVLVQEREALTIEALGLSGHRVEAEKRAAAFLRDYPKSPHAARVQAIIR